LQPLERALRAWNAQFAPQGLERGPRWQNDAQRPRRQRGTHAHHERRRPWNRRLSFPKNVGLLPVAADPETFKHTHEIKTAIPLLEPWGLTDKDITADALLTQRSIAQFVRSRLGHSHFSVKGNHRALLVDLERSFAARPRHTLSETSCGHGRIETRSISVTCALNGYLDFLHLAQARLIERKVVHKNTGHLTDELA
jgi:predicted transposase YbfD/YdcC